MKKINEGLAIEVLTREYHGDVEISSMYIRLFELDTQEDAGDVLIGYYELPEVIAALQEEYLKMRAEDERVDVLVGQWWLEPEAVADVARKLNVLTVPDLGIIDYLPHTASELTHILNRGHSVVSTTEGGNPSYAGEGIVARTAPLMLTRRGERIMWKLKFRDL